MNIEEKFKRQTIFGWVQLGIFATIITLLLLGVFVFSHSLNPTQTSIFFMMVSTIVGIPFVVIWSISIYNMYQIYLYSNRKYLPILIANIFCLFITNVFLIFICKRKCADIKISNKVMETREVKLVKAYRNGTISQLTYEKELKEITNYKAMKETVKQINEK